MLTFETKVYENDWRYILKGHYLDECIDRCNFLFERKVLLINNVKNINTVLRYAQKKVDNGIIDAFIIVDEYAKDVLKHFNLSKESFKGGYYYSIAELTGIFLCKTKYLLHFSSDSFMQKSNVNWIEKGIAHLETDPQVLLVNPSWKISFDEAKAESFDETDFFYKSYGFSDQCYLVRSSEFKEKMYHSIHKDSERYPQYGGELFEKRVDAFLRNNNRIRFTSKEVAYIHKNFPKSPIRKYIHSTFPVYFAKKRLKIG